MGPIGVSEMIAIFVIALLLFGPKKLPELGRTLGKALSEFRRAKSELKSTFESHLQELERETRVDLSMPKLDAPASPYTPYSSSNYSYPYDDSSPYGSTSTPYAEDVPASAGSSDTHTPDAAPIPPTIQPVQGTVARSNGVAPVATEMPKSTEEHPV